MKEQLDNLQRSVELSGLQVDDAVNPWDVAALFERERVPCALIGGHMVSFHTGSARATVAVEFIVGDAHFARATAVINLAYAHFRQTERCSRVAYDSPTSGLKDAQRIGLVRDGFPLLREVLLRYSIEIKSGGRVVTIPIIEAAVALMFATSISPNRGDENKQVDHADLLRLIRATRRIDNKLLMTLGDLIYRGGGNELAALVDDVRAGKPVSLELRR